MLRFSKWKGRAWVLKSVRVLIRPPSTIRRRRPRGRVRGGFHRSLRLDYYDVVGLVVGIHGIVSVMPEGGGL
jgi:hypothetical protein